MKIRPIKPLNALYAVIWFAVFTYAAWAVYSGSLFEADVNNRTRTGFALMAGIIENLGVPLTSAIIFFVGLGISAYVLFSKSSGWNE